MKNNPEQFNSNQPHTEKTSVEQKEKEPRYKPNRVVIAGPAHSGKSVFSTSIIENFPDGCNIFHATPDGEGDWSQSTEDVLAQKLREKEKFSSDFVEESIKMIKKSFKNYVFDEDDTHVVAGAKGTKAKVILSYNLKHFNRLIISEDFGITVLTPSQYLQYLRSLD